MKFPLALATALLALSPAAHAQTFKSSAGDLKVETVVGGLSHPWALAFLPEGIWCRVRPGFERGDRLLSRVSPSFLWTEQASTVRGTSSGFFRLPTFHFAMEQNNPTYKVENN